MDVIRRPGFAREDLRARYDIKEVIEDDWHSHTDSVTKSVLARHLQSLDLGKEDWVLNAGAGVTNLHLQEGSELPLDLFSAPIADRKHAVCGSIVQLPFKSHVFRAAVCVGEVLAYCDPNDAIMELARVVRPGGIIICDFGSTKSWRHIGTSRFGRAAVVLSSEYNGSDERTWIYDPSYILRLMTKHGLVVRFMYGAHAWSTIARRFGISTRVALAVEQRLQRVVDVWERSDTVTVVAELATA